MSAPITNTVSVATVRPIYVSSFPSSDVETRFRYLDYVFHHSHGPDDVEKDCKDFRNLAAEAEQYILRCGGTIVVARKLMELKQMEKEYHEMKADKVEAKAKQQKYYQKRKEAKAKA